MAVEHDYAEILRAIADGKEIEIRDGHVWKDIDDHEVLRLISDDEIEPRLVRVKPELFEKTVNVSIPIPITVEPKYGTMVYYPSVIARDMVDYFVWDGHSGQLQLLERGLLHLTEEAAIEHAKVLISHTQPD